LQLQKLCCCDVSLISYQELSVEKFNKIIEFFIDKRIKSIEIVSKFSSDNFLQKINNNVNQITRLIFHSATENKIELYDEKFLFDRIFTTQKITNFNSCGIVDTKYFNTNLPKVLEAIHHNSCLNRKISIDTKGNIKNCPSMPQSFGNIKETTLEEALNHKDFKKFWNITKDQIAVCKDCEFRYICTDCRAFLEKAEDIYSKPLKCGYNPYTAEWEEWSKNPLKQKAIEFYGIDCK
jgi:SPASM domain peptide maturase of grasp-with-spasm system